MEKLRDMPSTGSGQRAAGSGLSASRARRDNETERQLEKLEKLWQLAIRRGCDYVECRHELWLCFQLINLQSESESESEFESECDAAAGSAELLANDACNFFN